MKKNISKLGGREIHAKDIFKKGKRICMVALFCLKMKQSLSVFMHYVNRTSPEKIEFRNGLMLKLSNHPHDLITVFVVFCFKDYGNVTKSDVVLDIGGNIGVFAVFAAASGASKVYVFEPNQNAYKVLIKNISENNFTDVVFPINAGVGGLDAKVAHIAIDSSPYNRIQYDSEPINESLQSVNIIPLGEALSQVVEDTINIVKLDCEGAEFEIVDALTLEYSKIIKKIRMEFEPEHGSIDNVIKHLKDLEYSISLLTSKPNRLWAEI